MECNFWGMSSFSSGVKGKLSLVESNWTSSYWNKIPKALFISSGISSVFSISSLSYLSSSSLLKLANDSSLKSLEPLWEVVRKVQCNPCTEEGLKDSWELHPEWEQGLFKKGKEAELFWFSPGTWILTQHASSKSGFVNFVHELLKEVLFLAKCFWKGLNK